MYRLLTRINAYVVRWVRKKYERLRPLRKAARWVERVAAVFPQLFAHWDWVTSGAVV